MGHSQWWCQKCFPQGQCVGSSIRWTVTCVGSRGSTGSEIREDSPWFETISLCMTCCSLQTTGVLGSQMKLLRSNYPDPPKQYPHHCRLPRQVRNLLLWSRRRQISCQTSSKSLMNDWPRKNQLDPWNAGGLLIPSDYLEPVGQYLPGPSMLRDDAVSHSYHTTQNHGRVAAFEVLSTNQEIAQYQAVIGSLMYGDLGTQPDIAFATTFPSQFCSNQAPNHTVPLQQVLRYQWGIINLALVFPQRTIWTVTLHEFADASHVSDIEIRRFVSWNSLHGKPRNRNQAQARQ